MIEAGIEKNSKIDLIPNKVAYVSSLSYSPLFVPTPLKITPENQTIIVIIVLTIESLVIFFFLIDNIKDIKYNIPQIKIPISSTIINQILKAFPFDDITIFSKITNENIKSDIIKRKAIKHIFLVLQKYCGLSSSFRSVTDSNL